MSGNHVVDHARDCLCETSTGCMPWYCHGMAHLPRHWQEKGIPASSKTKVITPSCGRLRVAADSSLQPHEWGQVCDTHLPFTFHPGQLLAAFCWERILKLFPKQWSWIMLCSSQLHAEPRGVRGAAFHAVSQGYKPPCHRKKSAAVISYHPQIYRIFKHLILWSINSAS